VLRPNSPLGVLRAPVQLQRSEHQAGDEQKYHRQDEGEFDPNPPIRQLVIIGDNK